MRSRSRSRSSDVEADRNERLQYQDLARFLVAVAARSRGMTAVVVACGWASFEARVRAWLRSSRSFFCVFIQTMESRRVSLAGSQRPPRLSTLFFCGIVPGKKIHSPPLSPLSPPLSPLSHPPSNLSNLSPPSLQSLSRPPPPPTHFFCSHISFDFACTCKKNESPERKQFRKSKKARVPGGGKKHNPRAKVFLGFAQGKFSTSVSKFFSCRSTPPRRCPRSPWPRTPPPSSPATGC